MGTLFLPIKELYEYYFLKSGDEGSNDHSSNIGELYS